MKEHGKRSTYHAGCRCTDCRRANADYKRNRRATLREIPDQSWRAEAACAGMGAEWFHLEDRRPATAVAICDACPVKADCLADADAQGETTGIRGGVNMTRRRRQLPKIKTCPTCGDTHQRKQAKFCCDECAYAQHVARNDAWNLTHRDRSTTTCGWCGEVCPGVHRDRGFCCWECESSATRARTRRLLA